MPRPHWRKMTWVLIIWTVLILIWMIAGAAGNDCGSETSEATQSGCEAGTGIGVAIIGLLGFFGFVFLSLIWLMTRPKGRLSDQLCVRSGWLVDGSQSGSRSPKWIFSALRAAVQL
ncbi:hypothetical protein BH20ACT15_BH20ACT15_02390 [soil metagenome]